MKTVELRVPEAVLAEMDLPDEGYRGLGDYLVILEGLSVVTTTVVSLATITSQLEALALSIRQWIGSRESEQAILQVKGPDGFEINMPLPRNVSRVEILQCLSLLAQDRRL